MWCFGMIHWVTMGAAGTRLVGADICVASSLCSYFMYTKCTPTSCTQKLMCTTVICYS